MTKTLWTDGSASPNPGPGGFAVIENGSPVRLGRESHSSNIRMEGAALIAAMEYAGSSPCDIYTDSQFWVNVLEKWAPTWEANGWTKKSGKIRNLSLVKAAWNLYHNSSVTLHWTQGHVGTEMNELADSWANRARTGTSLPTESIILQNILGKDYS